VYDEINKSDRKSGAGGSWRRFYLMAVVGAAAAAGRAATDVSQSDAGQPLVAAMGTRRAGGSSSLWRRKEAH